MVRKFLRTSLILFTLSRAVFFPPSFAEDVGIDPEGSASENSGPIEDAGSTEAVPENISDTPPEDTNNAPLSDQEVTTIYVDENGEERVDDGAQEEVVEEEVVSNKSKPIYVDQESSITITDLDEGSSELNDPNAQVTITHIETDSGDITTTLQTQGTPDVEIDIKEKVDITKLIGPGGEFLFGDALSPQEKEELLRARKNATAQNEDREILWKDNSISVGTENIELLPGETITDKLASPNAEQLPANINALLEVEKDTAEKIIPSENSEELAPEENIVELIEESEQPEKDTAPLDILDVIEQQVEEVLSQPEEVDELPLQDMIDGQEDPLAEVDEITELAEVTEIQDNPENNPQAVDSTTTPLGELFEDIQNALTNNNSENDNNSPIINIPEWTGEEEVQPEIVTNPSAPSDAKVQIQPETLIASLYQNTLVLDDIVLQQDVPLPTEFDGDVIGTLSFGKENDYLLFSHPIAITFPTPNQIDGIQLEVQTIHDGDTTYNTHGLTTNPFATCAPDGSASEPGNVGVVNNGSVTIYTCSASTFVVTFLGGQDPVFYADDSEVEHTITVSQDDVYTGFVIGSLGISVDFWSIDGNDPYNPGTGDSHSSEKYLFITSPQGTTVTLLASGAYTDDGNSPRVTVLFDDGASVGISGLPVSGSFLPFESLSAFDGQDPVGDWAFTFGDTAEDDGLILFEVSLHMNETICGDGIMLARESCDDGNNNVFDGCTDVCELEEGWECVGTTPTVCTPTISGLQLLIDGSTVGSDFQDISGNGRDGTPYNGVTTGMINGETYMCFNGTNRYIEVNTGIITSYPFTVSTWVQTNNIVSIRGIVSLARSNASNVMYNIEHTGVGRPRARAQNTTARYATETTSMNTSDRYLLTALYNSTSSRQIYVNGRLEGSNTATASFNTLVNRWNIGRFADSSPSNYFDGCLDDVRVYNRALSSGEIYSLYAMPATLSTEITTNLAPSLTGTIDGFLDRIVLTISGNTYTGINNGDGTRTLPPENFVPALLASGIYTTTLTVTNPYDRSAVYTASFTFEEIPTVLVESEVILSTGNITVTLPENTTVSLATGDAVLTGVDELELNQLPAEQIPEDDRFEFGISGSYLIFSGLVIIEYTAPIEDGSSVTLEVHHLGDTGYNSYGLTTDPTATCLPDGSTSQDSNVSIVSGGIATFYTCGASTFTVSYVGGQNTGNFVDGTYTGKIITVTTGDVYTGFTIKSINVVADFRKIDGTDWNNPGTGTANSSEMWMSITSPIGTNRVLLASGAYTNPGNAPRVQVTFDDYAPAPPAGLPATGTFTPYQSLGIFSGENPIGDWTFIYGDTTTGDGLILFNADLQLSDHDATCADPIQTKFWVVGTQNDRIGEYSLATPGVLTSTIYNTGLSVTLQEATPNDVFLSDDGRRMYQVGPGTDAVFQYAVETPRDVTSALGLQFAVSQDNTMDGFYFKDDGTKMYSVGATNDRVYEYTLDVPWNLKSARFITSGSVSAQESVPAGVWFNTSGDTMYVIGSNGDDINQYSLPTPWSISGFTYDGASFNKSVAAQESVPTGFFFDTGGTRMWVIGSNGDDVNPYTLTGAREVRTAVYDGAAENKVVSAQDTVPADLAFSDDGMRMYVVGSTNDAVYEYLLTGAWSVKTATFNHRFKVARQETTPTAIGFHSSGSQMYVVGSTSDRLNSYYITGARNLATAVQPRFSIATQESGSTSLFFNRTGSKMYIAGLNTDRVHQYSLPSPWMVSGAVYDNRSALINQDTAPQEIVFRPDGLKMYMVGTTNDRVYQYTLTGARQVNTSSYDGVSLLVSSQDGTPNGLSFSPDGTRLYIIGASNDRVYQYILTGARNVATALYNNVFTGVGLQENTPMGVYFAYPELCDGLDNDCDGEIDEGSITTEYYLDADGDGQGTSGGTIDMCTLPENYVTNFTDCNDSEPDVYSGATEICDELDNDCDGSVDEGAASTFYIDADDDGQGSATGTARSVVDGGNAHTCALSPSDLVWCRGDDSQQQLGNGSGDTTARNTPVQVVTLTGIQDVSAGNSGVHSCALKADGTAWCRGGDGEQQLGDGSADSTSEPTPAQVALLTGIQQISVGTTHACAIIENETLRCRGDDGSQQLGNGNADTTDRQTPIQVVNLTGVQSVAAGSYFTCATIENGTVRCRGYDGQQQLGDGNVDTTNENTPAQVANLTGVQSITAGNQHACAVVANGTARCRGQDSSQQLGNGNADTTARQTPVQVVNLTGIQSITAGQSHGCALVENGAIWCRGEDGSQELGNGNADTTDRQTPVLATGMAVSTFVEAGGLHTCALKSNGPVRCRGRDIEQQLGNGSGDTTARQTPIQVVNLTGVGILLSCNVTETGYSLNAYDCNDGANAVYSGATEVCDELDNDCDASVDEGVQTTFYQDSDSDGQGTGAVTTGACAAPSGYTGNTRDCNDSDASIYSGATEICDVLDNDCDGSVDEYVQNTYYIDSDSDTYGFSDGVLYRTLALGAGHTCGVSGEKEARCWGDDWYQQLGNGSGDTTARNTPVSVTGLSILREISAGSYHTCAIKSGGTVRCRGYDGSQQLGDGNADTTSENTPSEVAGLTGVRRIGLGGEHSCAVKTDGTVRCRGDDTQQQLGNGSADTTDRQTPVQVVNLTGISLVNGGALHACALKVDGTVWCRGSDFNQQLGDGDPDSATMHTPGMVTGLTNVKNISLGKDYTCAVKTDGTARCRGRDYNQQLGNGSGDIVDRHTPVQVTGLVNVEIVGAGEAHSCALKTDGTVWCRGSDGQQQLGDGDIDSTEMHTPSQVAGLTNAGDLLLGAYHSCALKTDGTVRCRGYDDMQQLGDGNADTTSEYNTGQVNGLTGYLWLSGSIEACSVPGGYSVNDYDCNDASVTIYPGAAEITGDNINQSCDGTEICYLDFDDDTWRPTSTGFVASADIDCNDSGEAVYTDPIGDCNDGSGTIYSGAAEITGDNIDQSCDLSEICYLDGDDDGYRTGATYISIDADCDDPGEALAIDPIGDCDDTDDTVYSGAAEICDTIDNDCDGDIDEGFYSVTFYQDSDGDGYGTSAVTTGINCLDSEAFTGSCSEGLVGYWPFDTGASDFSTYGNHGTVGGNTHFTAAGQIASGATFDGNNDNVQVADTGSLDFTTGLTIDLWFYSTDANNGFLLNKQGTGNFGKYSIYRGNAGGYICTVNELGVSPGLLTGESPNNTWIHFVCTYDGEILKIYKDGVYASGIAYTGVIGNSASPLRMGEYLTFDYAGRLDEVKLYNRALGAREVANSYDYGSSCPAGYVTDSDDCDDSNATVYSGATEICDFLDNDCNGLVDDGITCGTVSISGAATFNITGVTTLGVAQNIQRTISGYFSVIDTLGSNSGYYTTLALSNLSGSSNSFANSIVQRRGTGLALITGDANTGVVIANDFTGFVVASGTNTFIKRDVGANGGKTGIYGAYIDLSITIPAFAAVDIYTGVIYYTLYEN